MAHYLQEAYAVSLRRSLHIANVVPSIWYYKKRDRGGPKNAHEGDSSSAGALWF